MVSRQDWANGYDETFTMTADPHLTSGIPDGTETISGLESLSRSYLNAAGQVSSVSAYFQLGGLTYSTSTMGTSGTNFYSTQYGYDVTGHRAVTISPEGTIGIGVFDGLGQPLSEWVGTNDVPGSGTWSPTNNTSPSNMVEVTSFQYDSGTAGDGNLTQETQYVGGSGANRVTDLWYDWRDREVATKAGVSTSETDSVGRPLTVLTYDNLNEVTEKQVYDSDGVTPTISSGVLSLPSGTPSDLRAQTVRWFDEVGQVYLTQAFSVDPTTGGAASYVLTTVDYRDPRVRRLVRSKRR